MIWFDFGDLLDLITILLASTVSQTLFKLISSPPQSHINLISYLKTSCAHRALLLVELHTIRVLRWDTKAASSYPLPCHGLASTCSSPSCLPMKLSALDVCIMSAPMPDPLPSLRPQQKNSGAAHAWEAIDALSFTIIAIVEMACGISCGISISKRLNIYVQQWKQSWFNSVVNFPKEVM